MMPKRFPSFAFFASENGVDYARAHLPCLVAPPCNSAATLRPLLDVESPFYILLYTWRERTVAFT